MVIRLEPFIFPDFTIEGSMPPGHCTRVEYTATMKPGLLVVASSGGSVDVQTVEADVECRDHAGRLIGRQTWFFPANGGTFTGVFQWPIPDDSGPWDPDWTGTATLTINPPGVRHVSERSSANNTITVSGTCVG